MKLKVFKFSDEVGALVFDPGHYSLRAGYAGEESPKVSDDTDCMKYSEVICKKSTEILSRAY